GGLAGATARVENAAGDSAGGAAVRRALRRLDDAGGASAQDALPGGEHLRATAAPAQGAARRLRGGKAPAAVGGTMRPSAHEKVWEYQMRYGRWDGVQAKDRRPGLQPRRKARQPAGFSP